MGFEAAVAACLRKYFVLRGRASRSEFWWFYLFVWTANFAVALLAYAVGNAPSAAVIVAPLLVIVRLGLLTPVLAAAVRRLHDTDRSGWWLGAPIAVIAPLGVIFYQEKHSPGASRSEAELLFSLLFLCVMVLLLVWMCTKGTAGENRYGSEPHGFSPKMGIKQQCPNCGMPCEVMPDGQVTCHACAASYQASDFQELACPACDARYRPADYRKGDVWTCSSCAAPLPQRSQAVHVESA
jgi:uncharacterized membrane protein YhaH (DUF805 family)